MKVGLIVDKWKKSIQEKGTQSTLFTVQSVEIIFILFKSPLIVPMTVIFSCHEKAHDNIIKNSVVKVQNLFVNDEK